MTTTSGQGWSGFLRLLMNQESANPSQAKRRNALAPTASDESKRSFIFNALTASETINGDYKFYILGEIFYFWIQNSEDLLSYCKDIRAKLLREGYFFKAVVTEGSFVATEIGTLIGGAGNGGARLAQDLSAMPELFGHRFTETLVSRVHGFVFDEQILGLHEREEQFKGIGFAFDPAFASRPGFVGSSYMSGVGKGYIPYADLAFTIDETARPVVFVSGESQDDITKKKDIIIENIGCDENDVEFIWKGSDGSRWASAPYNSAANLIDTFVENFLTSTTKSDAYARYYIPSFVSLVRSSDFSKIRYLDGAEWQAYPLIFHRLRQPAIRRQAKQVQGFEIVISAMAEAIFSRQGLDDATKTAFVNMLDQDVLKRVMALPPQFVSRSLRDEIAQVKTAALMFNAKAGR